MEKTFVITASGDRALSEIASEAVQSGFTSTEILDEIGCITGNAPQTALRALRLIPGVIDVSETPSVDIGPPGSSPA
jgi:hypothetical protein